MVVNHFLTFPRDRLSGLWSYLDLLFYLWYECYSCSFLFFDFRYHLCFRVSIIIQFVLSTICSVLLFISHYFIVVTALIYIFAFSNCLKMLYFKSRDYRIQALHLYDVGLRSTYTLPSPKPTCAITLGMLSLLYLEFNKFLPLNEKAD